MVSSYNGALLLQAMGLGGWSYDGIEHMALLGASGEDAVPGLGFRYDTDPRWGTPNPTGRTDGTFHAYCPPHFASMADAVEALAQRKFGPGGRLQRGHARSLERVSRDPRLRRALLRGVQGLRDASVRLHA